MGIQERKEREKAEIRKQIIGAAQKLFLEKGYQNVSLRNIAQEIEYSTTVIYKIFPNKQAILLQLFNEKYSALLGEFELIHNSPSDPPIQKLERLMWAYLKFGWSSPDYYHLAVINNVVQEERDLSYIDEDSIFIRIYEILVEGVEACQLETASDRGAAELFAQTIWACLHGALSLRIAHKDFPWGDTEKFFKSVVDTALSGIKRL